MAREEQEHFVHTSYTPARTCAYRSKGPIPLLRSMREYAGGMQQFSWYSWRTKDQYRPHTGCKRYCIFPPRPTSRRRNSLSAQNVLLATKSSRSRRRVVRSQESQAWHFCQFDFERSYARGHDLRLTCRNPPLASTPPPPPPPPLVPISVRHPSPRTCSVDNGQPARVRVLREATDLVPKPEQLARKLCDSSHLDRYHSTPPSPAQVPTCLPHG